ncbi:MAG TPA: Gfo/Idh/MocA family oxidoreductase [Planctomycetota bacterium]|nr:Gfo/Idh/MocA family oxidoreductase [Planctomycetota bacterium]
MAKTGGLGFGIVGLGTIAEFHAKAIQAMEGGHLVAAYTRQLSEKAHKFTADYGVTVFSGDFEAFLRTPGLDVVAIATPSGAHLEPALLAAKHRKHVISEKPLEVTLERCDKMIAACKKAKVSLAGIFPSRFGGAAQLIKRAIEKGRFGRLTVCNAIVPWWRTQQYYDSGGWRGTWDLDGGGALMNQSIHQIDMLQWLAGPVTELSAYASCLAHKNIEVEDAAVAALRFKSGALGVIVGSTAMYPGQGAEVQISGEKGSAWLKAGHLVAWQFDQEEPGDAEARAQFGPPAQDSGKSGASDPKAISFVGHQKQFENVARAIGGAEPLLVDGKEARKAVEIILAIYQSALSRKPVKLPLKKTPRRTKFR